MIPFSTGKNPSALQRGVALAVSGSLFMLSHAGAQNLTPTPSQPSSAAATDASAPVERVIVTGSNIPRNADEVPPTPVITIDRAGIENSGRATVSEVLQRLPINTGGNSTEAFSASFAPGASGLSLRGLGQNSTLTIIDGRRVAPYALPFNGTEAFTDLNSIPQAAVERIEILKDGASAIYGADAIAGVVNVILRDDYQGFEVTTRYGNTVHGDSGEYLEQLVTGFKTEKGSLLLTADYFKRNAQNLVDRAESNNANFTGIDNPGGAGNYTFPGGSAYTGVGTLPKGTPFTIDNRSSRTIPALLIVPNSTLPGGDPADTDTTAVSATPGTSGTTTADFAPGYTPYNFNTSIVDIPETERFGFFGKAKYNLFSWLTAYTELGYSNTKTKYQVAPSSIEGSDLVIPANNPFNPFGVAIGDAAGNGTGFRYRVLQAGPRIDRIEQDNYRALVGATVKLPMDFQVDSGALYSQSRVTDVGQNFLSLPATQAALNSTDPATALNVFSPNARANNQSVIDGLKVNTLNNSKAELLLFDTKVTGPIPYAKLPAGPVMLAVGGEYRDEKLVNQVDGLSARFQISGQGGVSTVGRRDVRAGYYEISIPVFSPTWNFPGAYALDLIAAQRYEDFSDFGGFSAPKFSIRYQPIKDLVLRGSYSEGVRAPSLSEEFAGVQVAFTQVTDPQNGGGGPDYQERLGGNPNLQPEKSYSYYGGFVYSPSYVKGLSVSVDYSEIIRRRTIQTVSAQFIVDNLPGQVIRNADGSINTIIDNYQNIGSTHVKTVDFEVNYNYDTNRFGVFSFDVSGSYLASYKVVSGLGVNPGENKLINYADTSAFGFALPDFKGQASLFYQYDFGTHTVPGTPGYSKDGKDGKSKVSSTDKNPAATPEQTTGIPQSIKLGLTVNYVDSYGEEVINDADTTGVPRLNDSPGTSLRTVQSFTTLDTLASYTIGFATFTLGINNILDEKPPYVYGLDVNSTQGYDFTEADSRGRFVYGEIKLKF